MARHLEDNGIACWIAPRDIRPGEPNWGKAIIEGLSNCQAMVLLLTQQSNGSQHVMKEAERAVNKKIPILVARFQPIDVSKELEYYVSSSQFLDATAPPLQQHLEPLLGRVREIIAAADRVPAIVTAERRPRPRPGSWLVPTVVKLLAVAAVAAVGFVAIPRLLPAVSALTREIARRPDAPVAAASGPGTAAAAADSVTAEPEVVRPEVAHPEPPPAAAGGSSDLLARVDAKARLSGSLEAFAKVRLATFHREALLVTKSGDLQPGKVNASDAEIMASCRIQPNMNGYTSLAKELIALLDKSAQQKGTITSDGLKTSEQYGHDARPHIQRIAGATLTDSYSLLGIFASDVHQTLVQQHARAGIAPFVSFASPFLIYDEKITGNGYKSGIASLLPWTSNASWNTLLEQEGTGIVALLDTTKNSYRHTTWRWFHLSPSDWATISSSAPWQFKCVFTLTDPSDTAVESDSYPLTQYGVGSIRGYQIMSLAPFFVNRNFEHYIPEITLAKPVVVLRDDVPRVKDYTVTIEEIVGRPR